MSHDAEKTLICPSISRKMGHIDADARDVEATLQRTSHNLKHGFTWRGAITSPFRRGAPKAFPKDRAHQDIAPVFTDEYTARSPSKSPTRAKYSSPKSATSHAGGGASAPGRGLVAKSRKDKEEVVDAATSPGKRSPTLPPSAGHVPEGFDEQLDVLDGLLDGLNVQAQAINVELRQQNDGIEVLAGRIEPAAAETASQARQIKRRFGVRG